MAESPELLQCYNRGCGEKYNPSENCEDSCRHHPGQPVFHDAYKGWSCCNKKCTDFTEFLNIRGCTLSKHSNEKPPEPVKPITDIPDLEVIEVKPIVPSTLERPPFESPMTTMKPEIAPSLKQQLVNTTKSVNTVVKDNEQPQSVQIGTNCKNGGCSVTYQGPEMDSTTCLYHPGCPVFHEGLKFWSCCQKRTSDFTSFLNQVGCERGSHVWIKKDEDKQDMKCRWDYHQTGGFVIVSIYAKNYCPETSSIQINPIRLKADILFPQENYGTFKLDIELRGIINVKESSVTMYGTKIEIKMKKAEPGSWAKIEVPRNNDNNKTKEIEKVNVEQITPQIDAVDLSDL